MGRMSCAKAHRWPGFWRFHELPTGMLVCWNAGLGSRYCRSLPGIEQGLTKSNLLIVSMTDPQQVICPGNSEGKCCQGVKSILAEGIKNPVIITGPINQPLSDEFTPLTTHRGSCTPNPTHFVKSASPALSRCSSSALFSLRSTISMSLQPEK